MNTESEIRQNEENSSNLDSLAPTALPETEINLLKNNIASFVKPKTTDSKRKNLLVKSKNSLVKPKSTESKPEEEKKSSSNLGGKIK